IGSIDSLLSAATLQSITNHRTNANRELLGQGIGNIASSLFGGLAGVGFMGRSIVSYHAGARTRLSSMIGSVILLLAIMLFARFLGYIPQVVMGAVVVVLAIQIIDPWSYQLIRDLFQKKVSHRQRLVTNLLVILLVMIIAIFVDFMLSVGVGVVVSIALFVQNMSKSIVKHVYHGTSYHSKKIRHEALQSLIKQHGDQIAVVELEGSIFFGASDTLVDQIDRLMDQGVKYIILDFKRVNHIDATGYKIFEQNYNRLKQLGCVLSFCYFSEKSKFWSEIEDFSLNKVVPSHLFFGDTDQALEYFEDELLKSLDANLSEDFEFTFKGFFKEWDFSDDEIESMYGYVERLTYNKGDLLFEAGDQGNSMFLLAKGIADIFIVLPTSGRMKRIYTITYGTVFGEMALLDDKPRSASVKAATDLICYQLSTEHFESMKENQPMIAMKFYLALCKILVNRLRDADNLISELEA
ncbi:MAG: SulP family inorganic anion transporter, partial [Saprospiraceae bacterium]|nr:SulP family inorganic anion transporter [Saprospiraceae bacterium]